MEAADLYMLKSVYSLFFSRSWEVKEDLPHSHQADGAGLQVQWAEAAWDLRYPRGLHHVCTVLTFSVWVALVRWLILLTCCWTHKVTVKYFMVSPKKVSFGKHHFLFINQSLPQKYLFTIYLQLSLLTLMDNKHEHRKTIKVILLCHSWPACELPVPPPPRYHACKYPESYIWTPSIIHVWHSCSNMGSNLFLCIDTLSLPDISQTSHPHSAPPPSNSLPRTNPGGHRHRWVRGGAYSTCAWHCLKCFGPFFPPSIIIILIVIVILCSLEHISFCWFWSKWFNGDEIQPREF